MRLDEKGFPIIEVIPVFEKNGERFFSQFNLKAVIDTGAYNCFIAKELIFQLGLVPKEKKIKINKLLSGICETETYDFLINIPIIDKTIGFEVCERIGDYPYPIILGNYFLENFEFNYNGRLKTFDLKFLENNNNEFNV